MNHLCLFYNLNLDIFVFLAQFWKTMKLFQNNENFRRLVLKYAGGGRKSETFIPMA